MSLLCISTHSLSWRASYTFLDIQKWRNLTGIPMVLISFYTAAACEQWNGDYTSGINDPFTPLNRPAVRTKLKVKRLGCSFPLCHLLVHWHCMKDGLLFQFSHCHNGANEICSLVRQAMKLKNSEMHCVQASAQMQSRILRWYAGITVPTLLLFYHHSAYSFSASENIGTC